MNQAQIHLLVNHLPVIGSLAGLLILAAGFLLKNNTVKITGSAVVFMAALFIIPAYLTGEGAEDIVEKYNVSETLIEQHEEAGKLAMIVMIIAGVMAAAAWLFARFKTAWMGVFQTLTLLTGIVAFGLTARTAHLGGQIRHPEITNTTAAPSQGTGEATAPTEQEDDD